MTGDDRLELRVREALQARADAFDQVAFPVDWFDGLLRRGRQRRRLRALGVAAVVAAIAVIASLLLPAVVRRYAEPTVDVVPKPGQPLGQVVARWDVPASADLGPPSFALAGGRLWVAAGPVLEGLDPASLRARMSLSVNAAAGLARAMTAADGGRQLVVTWFNGVMQRFDTATGRLLGSSTLPGVAPVGVASGFGAIWVASGSDAVVARVSPTGQPQGQVPVGSPPPSGVRPIVTSATSVWVADDGGQVSRIDPNTNREVGRIPLGRCCVTALLTDPSGAVWAATSDGHVLRVPATGGRVGPPLSVDGSPTGLAWYRGALWVLSAGGSGDDGVDRVDPVTGRVTWRVALHASGGQITAGPGGVVVTDAGNFGVLLIRAQR